jgi:hypothetical protein
MSEHPDQHENEGSDEEQQEDEQYINQDDIEVVEESDADDEPMDEDDQEDDGTGMVSANLPLEDNSLGHSSKYDVAQLRVRRLADPMHCYNLQSTTNLQSSRSPCTPPSRTLPSPSLEERTTSPLSSPRSPPSPILPLRNTPSTTRPLSQSGSLGTPTRSSPALSVLMARW